MAAGLDLFHWTAKQAAATATADVTKYTLFGGFRGPGKSYWLRWYLLRFLLLCQAHGLKGVKVGLFCEDYPVLKDRQISKIRAEFPRALGAVKDTKTDGLGFYLNDGGGVLALRNLDDPSKYMGAEFAAIGVDQLEKNKLDTFNQLRGSLRWPGIKNTRFVATANPGGIGHLWVKQFWLDGIFPEEMQRIKDQFAFVRAAPDDNPHLDASYWEMLETLPTTLARAWRWGEWDVFAGQVFTTWRHESHTCDPFEIPATWPRWLGIDWGRSNPWCCLWLTQNPETGRVYVYREAYERDLTDRAQARKIKTLSGNDKIEYRLADPSMWTKKSHEDSTFSTYDEYLAEGVYLQKADNDRMTGKRKVDSLLEAGDDGPQLVVFRTCTNLIRTLPALPYDPVAVEDVDTKGEDHAYDALKYGLSRVNPRPVRKPVDERSKQVDRIEKLVRRSANRDM